jgi:ribosomal protein S18 acetylase RimI-like enzyme
MPPALPLKFDLSRRENPYSKFSLHPPQRASVSKKESANMATQTSKRTPMIIRPAKLSDYKILGRIASITYFPTPFTAFLMPNRLQYYTHYERGFQKRALTLMLDPRVRSMVACEATKPDVPVGYIHFKRLGDDQVAKRIIREKTSVQLWILRWLAWAWYLLLSVVLGNKAEDPKALKVFFEWAMEDDEIYWKPHKERHNRWHIQSFVVLPMFQGKGVGKRLMAEVTKRAVEENVCIGLEASPEGEFLVGQSIVLRWRRIPRYSSTRHIIERLLTYGAV